MFSLEFSNVFDPRLGTRMTVRFPDLKPIKKVTNRKILICSLLYQAFIIRDRYKQFLQQILMSSGGESGVACSSMVEREKGEGVLIAGCFAINHAPECQLVLTLKHDVLLINESFPTKQPHPVLFPITPDLAYRITLPMPAGSQNPFWLLQLRNGKTEMALRSVQFDSLDRWQALLRRYLYKFGFWEDFKPVRRISRGTSSAVYEVVRVVDGKRFAVKAFGKAQFQQNKNLLVGLEKEIKVLREIGELKHSHLLGIEEVYDSDSSIYIVMELCGKDLLKGRVGEGSRQEKVRQAMRQLLSGLAALHDRGMVHRDIKPNNIMFREDGRFELVITDFGLAMHLEEEHPFVQCGTPGFVAPEVFLLTGNQRVKDCACDIFSMGVVFHILLTGQPLFKAETPKELFIKNSKMDFDLTQEFYQSVDPLPMNLLRKMLQIDSKDRITADQALKHEYFSNSQIKMQSPAPTFQSNNQFLLSNQQQFSQINLGIMGRKRHKGEYRKASHL